VFRLVGDKWNEYQILKLLVRTASNSSELFSLFWSENGMGCGADVDVILAEEEAAVLTSSIAVLAAICLWRWWASLWCLAEMPDHREGNTVF
jgi:hypothetical protein